MTAARKDTTPVVIENPIYVGRVADLGDNYTVAFETIRQDIDTAAVFRDCRTTAVLARTGALSSKGDGQHATAITRRRSKQAMSSTRRLAICRPLRRAQSSSPLARQLSWRRSTR
jgi:hypothetical protein